MTISPVGPPPAAACPPDAGGAGDAAGDFHALVAATLTDEAAAGDRATAADPAGSADSTEAASPAGSADAADAGGQAQVAGPVDLAELFLIAGALPGQVRPSGQAPGLVDQADPETAGDGPPLAEETTTGASGLPTLLGLAAPVAPPTFAIHPGKAGPPALGRPIEGTTALTPGLATLAEEPAGPGSQSAAATAPAPDQASAQAPVQAPAPVAAQTDPAAQPTQLAPVGVATAAQPVADSQATSAATRQVTGQVFPEVTRLVSRGDGTQRITLHLRPESLGEVRVVLTVRNGDVHVRLAAGEQAQLALLRGAPELHRLLELTGATSTQVVVNDLSGAGSSTDTDQFGQTSSRSWADAQDRAPDQPARMWDGDTSARDGMHNGAAIHRSDHPGTGTRTSGVDVTM